MQLSTGELQKIDAVLSHTVNLITSESDLIQQKHYFITKKNIYLSGPDGTLEAYFIYKWPAAKNPANIDLYVFGLKEPGEIIRQLQGNDSIDLWDGVNNTIALRRLNQIQVSDGAHISTYALFDSMRISLEQRDEKNRGKKKEEEERNTAESKEQRKSENEERIRAESEQRRQREEAERIRAVSNQQKKRVEETESDELDRKSAVMMALHQRLGKDSPLGNMGRDTLEQMAIKEAIKRADDVQRRIALGMGLHPRGGEDSPVNQMHSDALGLVVKHE